ncbi:MAG: ATP-dependent DNA helicase RecG [Chloroflexi bacterium]|nr:ATP-dependent DNA helicase RecG [Chloroflexota bacterium]
MPSALETLVKILKLEQNTGYKNTAVIGGLESFAAQWVQDAHQQAKRPEHHQLVDELERYMADYAVTESVNDRHQAIKYMLGRIMGRIPAPPDLPPSPYAEPSAPSPAQAVSDPSPTTAEDDSREDVVEGETASAPQARDAKPEPERDAAIIRDPNDVFSGVSEAAADVVDEYDSPIDNDVEDEAGDETESHDAGPRQRDRESGSSQTSPRRASASTQPSAPAAESKPAPPPRRKERGPLNLEEALAQLEELRQPVTVLPKVGEKMAEKLGRLGIQTVHDMLVTLPRRYDDYSRMRTINQLQPGEVVTVIATVQSLERKKGRGGQSYLLVIMDDLTGSLHVTFFGQMWLQRQFKQGSRVVLSGKVELFRGQMAMTNPEWEMIESDNLHTNRIVPVYPLTKGLSARTMRRLTRQALDSWAEHIPDHLPDSVLDRTELGDLAWALREVHFPESHPSLQQARTRLTFDDVLLFQMAMLQRRREWQSEPGYPITVPDEWILAFLETLPYALTGAQGRVLGDIREDIARDVPMNRLLQGDVGSGKTVVAAMTLAMAVNAGYQGALMAPTSILAEQHARSITSLLHNSPDGANIQVRLLTGNTSEAERADVLAGLADGSVNVIIGTHALIQEGVALHNLGVAIIDEQHRFGVEQRGALRGKGHNPHVLVMTATPIPRTLALTLYADLDLSTIDELPPGRIPVETRVLLPHERERAFSFVHAQLSQGRQVFIVYPLVEASEKLDDIGAAVEEYESLQAGAFRKYRVGLLHGRMSPAEKEDVMTRFAAAEIDVLVSTSVIEVGIDVPNASVILIENAERFGLAQLHQFRGRVGRGEHKSYCLLMNTAGSEEASHRLQSLEETTDGFRLAQIDWELRGPGDLLGVRQSGVGKFRLAELIDPRLVELAQREARTLYAEDPGLDLPEHGLLSHRVYGLLDERMDVS